jgi:hypothetical protein
VVAVVVADTQVVTSPVQAQMVDLAAAQLAMHQQLLAPEHLIKVLLVAMHTPTLPVTGYLVVVVGPLLLDKVQIVHLTQVATAVLVQHLVYLVFL